MNEKTIAGYCVKCNDQGFMEDLNEWNEDIAKELAKEESIELTEKHWTVLKYLQDQCKEGVDITMRKVGKSGIVDIKEFYQLFPKAPLKTASKLAGIPKPVSCI